MISIEQWRLSIGGFCPKALSSKQTKLRVSTLTLNQRAVSLAVRVLLFSSLLLLAGDIESNPGPVIDNVLSELREFRQANEKNFENLRNEFTTLKSEINKIWRDLNLVKGKVDQTNKYIDQIYEE